MYKFNYLIKNLGNTNNGVLNFYLPRGTLSTE